ncbi:MAG: class I SAM-dependent methyltransferase [Burkholderiaceae bacterium]
MNTPSDHRIESTAWVPLMARALGPVAWPWLAPPDAQAQQVANGGGSTAVAADPLVTLNVLWRTQLLREAARSFFSHHPDAIGVNLGCGLSNPFPDLDTGLNRWIDADLPDALRTRHRAMPHTRRKPQGARCSERTVDLREPGWWRALGLPERNHASPPVFVQCEGVMMYLTPRQAHAALHEFAERAPDGSQWAMDVISSLGVGCAGLVPSLAASGAQFRWGVRDLDELKAIHPRLDLLEAHSVAECWGPAGLMAQAMCWPWLGAPPYSVVTLSV